MKDSLAEKLLARLFGWTPEEVARERPILEALAAYKYDEYQQFSAGSRFTENLMLWLDQFRSPAERRTAYDWVKSKLVFCSSSEMRHLVEIAYPHHIRPTLLGRVAEDLGISPHRVAQIAASKEFAVRQRQCLFLGLSDGARIDTFRRSNSDDLNHEQIWQTYEISEKRAEKLLKKLNKHLDQLTGVSGTEEKFRTLVLLDDFSASGTSYYALPAEAPEGGKILDLFQDLSSADKPLAGLVDWDHLEVFIVLYMATEQAIEHLQTASEATWGSKNIRFNVEVVQLQPRAFSLKEGGDGGINQLIEHQDYYDHEIHDEHFEKGGTEHARYGYAACGLPLVLHHNTPNNSIALLMSYEELTFRGLFPRVRRHKEMS